MWEKNAASFAMQLNLVSKLVTHFFRVIFTNLFFILHNFLMMLAQEAFKEQFIDKFVKLFIT